MHQGELCPASFLGERHLDGARAGQDVATRETPRKHQTPRALHDLKLAAHRHVIDVNGKHARWVWLDIGPVAQPRDEGIGVAEAVEDNVGRSLDVYLDDERLSDHVWLALWSRPGA